MPDAIFMADAIHNAISILLKESSLSENEMHAAVLQVMDGNSSPLGLGMLLTGLRLKGGNGRRNRRRRARPARTGDTNSDTSFWTARHVRHRRR
jgi:hypothetical protein